MMHGLKWSSRFFDEAELVSRYSKDPSTKVGAVIVNNDRIIISKGYNGFPRGVSDSSDRLNDRETKYKFMVHAERNALYNALRSGAGILGCSMYITAPPCYECVKSIIQSGISEVVFMKPGADFWSRWKADWEYSTTMLNEAKVCIHEVDIVYMKSLLQTYCLEGPAASLE